MTVRREYFEKGLSGLSRAHLVNPMTGHLGAALVAGYLFSQDHHELDGRVHAGIEKELDRILKGESVVETAPERRQGFGGLWHIINHAAALIDLSEYGYPNLAQRGLEAHHRHVRLWRSLPNVVDELGAEDPAEHDPCTVVYWESGTLRRDRARLTHRIKTLYGFYRLVDLVDDPTKVQQAEDSLRYLM